MSLEVDGVWKANVWAPTVWVLGVWAEGGVVVEEEEEIPGSLRKSTPPRDLSHIVKWLKQDKALKTKTDREVREKVNQIVELGLISNEQELIQLRQREVLALIYIILALDV